MQPADFFVEETDPFLSSAWAELNVAWLDSLRREPSRTYDDLEVALALAELYR